MNESKSPTESWLEEFLNPGTRRKYGRNFAHFLEWAGVTDAELVREWEGASNRKQWAKKTGSSVMKFYRWLTEEKGLRVNSARAEVIAVMSFFHNQCDEIKLRRGALPEPEMAMNEHEFRQEELRAMFHYSDVKGKAILALGVALGWGADDFLGLKWAEIKSFLNVEPFTGFWYRRGKTGAPSRSHLTPEAVESLRAWRKVAKSDVHIFANGKTGRPWTNAALNYTIREIAKKAGIAPRGKISFHLIRKFTMRQLSNAKLNRWHVKILVGKKVPKDILTYLQDNTDVLREEFKEAYPRFSLTRGINNNTRGKLAEQERTIAELKELARKNVLEMSVMRGTIDDLTRKMKELGVRVAKLGRRAEEETEK